MLKELSNQVREVRQELVELNQQTYACGIENLESIELDIANKTNQLFDAVNSLNDELFAQTGVRSHELFDFTRHNGYVMGKNIVKPETLNWD